MFSNSLKDDSRIRIWCFGGIWDKWSYTLGRRSRMEDLGVLLKGKELCGRQNDTRQFSSRITLTSLMMRNSPKAANCLRSLLSHLPSSTAPWFAGDCKVSNNASGFSNFHRDISLHSSIQTSQIFLELRDHIACTDSETSLSVTTLLAEVLPAICLLSVFNARLISCREAQNFIGIFHPTVATRTSELEIPEVILYIPRVKVVNWVETTRRGDGETETPKKINNTTAKKREI